MRTSHAYLLGAALVAVGALGCPNNPSAPPAEPATTASQGASAASQPAAAASQPVDGKPAHHPTSTTPMSLDALFAMPKIDGPYVAEVAGEKIPKDRLESKLRELQLQLTVAGIPKGTSRRKVLQAAVDQLVERALMKQVAAELKVKPDPKAVDAFVDGLETKMAAEPAFKAFLENAGNTAAQRRRDGEHAATMQAIHAALRTRIQARTATTVEAHYEKRKADFLERGGTEAWRIVLAAPSSMVQRDRDIAKVKALQIHDKAKKNPDDFENLARLHSEGGKSGAGGYIGFVPKGALDPSLDAALHAAAPGTILPLIEDPRAFYIYKAGKKRKDRQRTLEESREEIFERLYRGVARREISKEVQKLNNKRQVTINVPELQAAP